MKTTLHYITEELTSYGCDNPRREAELFLMHMLDCERHVLYHNPRRSLNDLEQLQLTSFLEKRRQRQPHQYIVGSWDFLDLELMVDERVLIPRPETALLVHEVDKAVTSGLISAPSPVMVDIGTGCGPIAISMARLIPQAHIYATDISPAALEVALHNAEQYHCASHIWFLEGDLLAPLEELGLMTADCIISNPPYVPVSIKHELAPELSWEPAEALFAEEEGVAFHRRLIHQSWRFLVKGGLLMMELGFGQRSLLEEIIRHNGRWETLRFVKDTQDIDRVVVLQKR